MSKVAAALESTDLRHYAERGCDVDTVRALGLAGIRHPLGVLVVEALEGCAGESRDSRARLRDLTEAVRRVVERQAARHRIAVQHKAVAGLVVRELVLSQCPRCQGRGFLPLAYGPEVREDRGAECMACFASGRARRDFGERARVAGHPEYSAALQRFYESVEGAIAYAEMCARQNMAWRGVAPE